MPEFTRISLGGSNLTVTPICLGTMTFGQQVGEAEAHRLLDHAVACGVDFVDTAEMYSVPPSRDTFGATERILGSWFAARPGMRSKVVLATKVAGPSRNMDWIRGGSSDLTAADIVRACDDSLSRLRTDVIDLYQIHWPSRQAPMFGALYFEPQPERVVTSIHEQLQALNTLVRAGKVRQIGLSNETPWGVCEFVRLSEAHGLPRVVSVQNPYALVNRALDNGLDEVLYRLGVSMLAYSPLGFGTLTGKYDEVGLTGSVRPGRLSLFKAMRQQRWARPEALHAARLYNALAREHGLTPTRLALAFCYSSSRVKCTIIGVTSKEQLDENLAAWGTPLSAELLQRIDAIRWTHRDPAQ